MKRSIIVATLAAAALLLAACGTTNASFDPNTGVVTGLKSHDAANVANTKAYTDAKVKQPQKALVSLKAHPGQQITINAAEFTVWQPTGPQDDIAQPRQAESEFVQNTRAIGGLVRDATPLGLGAMALSDRNNARSSAERVAATSADVSKAQITADAAESAANREAIASANAAALAALESAAALSTPATVP